MKRRWLKSKPLLDGNHGSRSLVEQQGVLNLQDFYKKSVGVLRSVCPTNEHDRSDSPVRVRAAVLSFCPAILVTASLISSRHGVTN